ncbi:hypothetical protein PILCRDRAFT_12191 [Piloderma croceum F 1598]|uniref:Uncharacterized protein n=1 Tax=Piloderma croceum (strain F 1598) TaxID=765440 RepID=A0A0C3FBG8_PILCF|nr:hypothetical protein PILCRDRAFT_12191 [Piloderma croceum F 1598]
MDPNLASMYQSLPWDMKHVRKIWTDYKCSTTGKVYATNVFPKVCERSRLFLTQWSLHQSILYQPSHIISP